MKRSDASILWETWFAGWRHAQGKTVKDLGLAFTGFGGENQLKDAFDQWYRSNGETLARTPLDLSRALRNLRHLYEQMLVPGAVTNTESAAKGLLGPAIEQIERAATPTAALQGKTPDGMLKQVIGCSRCGGTHTDLPTWTFATPVPLGEDVWDRWAMCPTNHEPILIATVATPGKDTP